jgi:hypothetical protein
MKKYVKKIDDKKIYKTRSQIVIIKDGMSTYNPTEEMILADGWEELSSVIPEKTVESYRQDKLHEIKRYDESNSVNEFYIQGLPVWLDKNTRVGLKLRFESEKALGYDITTLWYGNNQFTLNLSDAFAMLYAIEIYASQCYDNTQLHLANVSKLETAEEIESYDFRSGYPEKLNF